MLITVSNLCIIPARGGSKRIPRKNIKNFLGKPIIAYSIETARTSELFDEVMVSTDDQEIADIASSFGASVPFLRSKENANDMATTIEVIKEVIDKYASEGRSFDNVCCLYPTAPFAKVIHLKDGLQKLQEQGLDSVFPVLPFDAPVWRGLRRKDGFTRMIWPENQNARSQDLETVFYDAGQWYWLKVDQLSDALWTQATDTIVLSPMEAQDIDNPHDWQLAELKFRLLNGN